MPLRIVTFITIFVAAILAGCSKHSESLPPVQWPSLANYPCVSGRVAATNDVVSGRAVFVLQTYDGKPSSKPLEIEIPQYAYHTDPRTQVRTPCVIIQAEELQGNCLIGCRTIPDGKLVGGLDSEFKFLGDTPPKAE